MEIKQFKEELRERISDFAISGYLINIGSRRPTAKEREVEEVYVKLEKWIFDNMTVQELNDREITPKDILDNGFNVEHIDNPISENQSSLLDF